MRQKEQRWYDVDDGRLRMYNHADPRFATSESICWIGDLEYYKSLFDLRRVFKYKR